MAINIPANRPVVLIALDDFTFAQLGFTAVNISIIYEVDARLTSWMPGRVINGLNRISKGKGYYLVAKIDMDKSGAFAPPVPEGREVSFSYITDNNGQVILT